MTKRIFLVTNRTAINKAAFPDIDAHNHLRGNRQVEKVIQTMEEVAVFSYCDLTSNVRIELYDGGYVIRPKSLSDSILQQRN